MQLKNLLLAGLVVTGLSACSNDSLDVVTPEQESKFDTYLTVNLSNPKSLTRATPEEGTVGESTIDKPLHVYLTKNGFIQYASLASLDSKATTEKKTVAIGVPAGTYDLFVIANSDSPLRQSGSINSVIKDITEDDAKGGLKKGKFIMSTAVTEPNIAVNGGAEITINEKNTKTEPAQATVTIDRLAAKVINKTTGDLNIQGDLATIKEGDEPFFTAANPIKFDALTLVNGNKAMNEFQEWSEEIEGTISAGKYIVTPQGKLESLPTGGQVMGGYYNPFTDLATVNAAGEIEDLTIKPGNEAFSYGNEFYTTENRPNFVFGKTLTSGMAQTTAVVYRTKANNGVTFYYVGGSIYTSIDDIDKLPAFAGKDVKNKSIPALRALGIKVYEKGNMYYSYFIQDKGFTVTYKDAQGVEKTSVFNSVLRNAIYSLTIDAVKNIGDDVPGGGKITPENPNPPIDPSDVWLDVTVKINMWTLNEIGIEF